MKEQEEELNCSQSITKVSGGKYLIKTIEERVGLPDIHHYMLLEISDDGIYVRKSQYHKNYPKTNEDVLKNIDYIADEQLYLTPKEINPVIETLIKLNKLMVLK